MEDYWAEVLVSFHLNAELGDPVRSLTVAVRIIRHPCAGRGPGKLCQTGKPD